MRTNAFQNLSECTEFQRLTRTPVPRFLHGTLLILCLLIGTTIGWLAFTEANVVVVATGRIRPVAGSELNWQEMTTDLASESGGVVSAVLVAPGDRVRQGDVLLEFETAQTANERSQLESEIAFGEVELNQLLEYQGLLAEKSIRDRQQAWAELEKAKQDLEQKRLLRQSNIRATQAELDHASDLVDRIEQLNRANAVSQQERSEARTRLATAREKLERASLPVPDQQIAVLESSLESIEKNAAAKQKEIDIQIGNRRAELNSKRIVLAELQRKLELAKVVATSSGVVTEVGVQVGDVLKPGKLGISTAAQESLAILVHLPSSDVGQLNPGMPVRVKLDAYDYRDYGVVQGTVRCISPDSTVVAGPNNQQGVAYQVTIQLDSDHLHRGDHHGDIKLGMTGTTEIVSRRKSLLKLLFHKIRGTISLS